MSVQLMHKHILLGVTGGIAAYKSPDLVRRLREAGAEVRVVMTINAKRFITPLTMQAVSGFPVHDDLFDVQAEAAMGHIALARWADLILIAPTTADCMARVVYGHADDLLTTICLATRAPIVLAPAMNQVMWKNTLTENNMHLLKQKKIHVLKTAEGNQACGDVGPGRMLEPKQIIEEITQFFKTGALAGLKVLITAGPTHEPIDPVRYITNKSSGKMGFSLAESAYEAGAKVTLICGPVSLSPPPYLDYVGVKTANDMYTAVMRNISEYDIFLAVAAVGDYSCQEVATQKIHKTKEKTTLNLKRNQDIVAKVGSLSHKPFIVGFAAETEDLVDQAVAKRQQKKMDMIVANLVEVGMGTNDNEVVVITENRTTPLTSMSKPQLARVLIAMIAEEFNEFKKRA